MRKVYGIGVADIPGWISTQTKYDYYEEWASVFTRCYSRQYAARRPTYEGCEVAEEWHLLSNFKKWRDEQTYRLDGWSLDKDFLSPFMPGKIYSPDTCCYLPSSVNNLFLDNRVRRGRFPTGVCFDRTKGKFLSQLNAGGERICKRFNTLQEAHTFYLKHKREHAHKVVEEAGLPLWLEARVIEGVERQLNVYEGQL